MDEFEKFLSRQPLRSLPHELRREVLRGAPAHQRRWREWLWPSPVAWAALVAVWVVIIGLNLASRPSVKETATRPLASPADFAVALAEQRRLLAELTGPESTQRSPQGQPGPRSERILDIRET